MTAADILLQFGGAYCVIGAIVAIAFVSRGIHRVDPSAQHAGWAFRIMMTPGCATLWPLILSRWIRAAGRTGRQA